MNSITRSYIDEHDIVARYLADQLSDEDRKSFEAYYLEHPEVVSELNRTAEFKAGLIDLRNSGKLPSIIDASGLWHYQKILALAASMLLAVALGFTLVDRQERSVIATSASSLTALFEPILPITESLIIERTRSSTYDASIRIPKSRAAIELRIKPESRTSAHDYSIQILQVRQDGSRKAVATLGQLQLGTDGFVTIYFEPADLGPGVYELDIQSDANSASSQFLIELLGSSNN